MPRQARDKWKERLILKTPAAFVGFNEDPAPGVGKYCECDTGAVAESTGGIPEQILVSKDIVYGSAVNRKPTFGANMIILSLFLCSFLMKNVNGHLPRQAPDDKHKENSETNDGFPGEDGEAQVNEVTQTLLLDFYRPSGWHEFAEPEKR